MISDENSTKTYVFDSYAILEMLAGSEKYKKYRDTQMITTKLNVFEVTSRLLQMQEEKAAECFVKDVSPSVRDYPDEVLLHAAKLWKILRKKHISMTDCIGYTLAFYHNIPFLTGDKVFCGMRGVEYVK